MVKREKNGIQLLPIFFFPAPAFAHLGNVEADGVVAGMMHPFLGADHLLVMIAVGLWAYGLGTRARWFIPLCFMLAMTVGAVLAFLDISIAYPEFWVALSVLASGVVLMRDWRFTVLQACLITTAFAISHGYLHALEIVDGVGRINYSMGFLISTAALHVLGLSVAWFGPLFLKWIRSVMVIACAAVGLTLLLSV